MNNVFVPDELQMMPQGVYHQLAIRWPHMFLTLTPSYLGLSQAIFDFTVAYLRGKSPDARKTPETPAQTSRGRRNENHVGELTCVVSCAIAEAGPNPSKEARLPSVHHAVHSDGECEQDRRARGSHLWRTKHSPPLATRTDVSRFTLWVTYAAWTAELCIERLGRESLYEPGERDE